MWRWRWRRMRWNYEMTKEQEVKKRRVQNYLRRTQQWQVNLPERSMRQGIRTALMEAL
jgi:hypothetical protein